jgi:hypothetical protein
VVEGGKLLTMDEEEVIQAANPAVCGLLQRTGLQNKVKSHYPTRYIDTFVYTTASETVWKSARPCVSVYNIVFVVTGKDMQNKTEE